MTNAQIALLPVLSRIRDAACHAVRIQVGTKPHQLFSDQHDNHRFLMRTDSRLIRLTCACALRLRTSAINLLDTNSNVVDDLNEFHACVQDLTEYARPD